MKFFVLLIGAVCVSMLTATAACADPRPITVTITASDPDGTPIPNMPLQCLTLVGAAFGITGLDGQVVLTLDANENETYLAIRLWDGRWHADLTIDQRILAEQRCEELRHMFSFKPMYTMRIESESDIYSFTLQPSSAVRVRGRLVNAQGEPVVGAIGAAHAIAFDDVEVDDNGEFDFGGVRKGAKSLILAQSSTQVHFIEITAVQTSQNLDLGDVVVMDTPADAPVRVSLQNKADLFDSTGAAIDLSVTFISTNGTFVLGFPADLEGNVLRELFYVPPRLPLLPPGEYYAIPGLISSQSGMALYLSIREGRQVLLDAAGVPKFTAISGQEVSLIIDARAAYEAVVQVGGDLVPE
jgi:hypothetical protein